MKLLFLVLLVVAAVAGQTADVQLTRCIPLSTFKLDCNTCGCTREGKIGWCTLIACAKNEGIIKYIDIPKSIGPVKHLCKPNTTFKSYCNTCHCASDGKSAACTRMACSEEIWNPDGTLKKPPPSS